MNKLILILTFLPFCSLIAQEEYPIFSVNNNWWIKAHTIDGSYQQTWFYDLNIIGDTLINGQDYKIMEDHFLGNYAPWWHNSPNFLGYDDDNKTYLRLNDSIEILLYDFNLEVGDTFQVTPYYNIDTFSIIIVQEIDSVELFDGSLRKRYNFGPLSVPEMDFIFQNCGSSNEFTWIDGIGASFHPLYAIWDCFEAGPDLDCYSYEDEESFGPCLYSPVKETYSDEIKVFPNPFINQIIVKDPSFQIENMTLFHVDGTIIKTFTNQKELEMTNLPNGVYFLHIELKNNMKKNYKLIK